MTCCTGHCAAAGFFSSRIAERDLRRYQRRGPAASTRMLLTELRRSPLQGLHLLDVGAGIGVIPVELATVGLAGATLADASPAFLEVARRNVGSRYGSRPTQFVVGDFALTGATLPEADIVALDRVVCCYPDAESLLCTAAARSRRLLAFTHPRDRWFLRAGFALGNFIFWLLRNPFRIFVHTPQRMASVLEAAGFVRSAQQESFLWSFLPSLPQRWIDALSDAPDQNRQAAFLRPCLVSQVWHAGCGCLCYRVRRVAPAPRRCKTARR